MNIYDFVSTINLKLADTKDTIPFMVSIDDYDLWGDDQKQKLKELISTSPSRLILVSCGPTHEADSREFQRIAKQAYLTKYMQEYKPNQKKINPAKLTTTPANIKIVIQSVEQKKVLPDQTNPARNSESPSLLNLHNQSDLSGHLILEAGEENNAHQRKIKEKLGKKFPESISKDVGALLQWVGRVFDYKFASSLAGILSKISKVNKNQEIDFDLKFLRSKTTMQQFVDSPQAIQSLEKLAGMNPAARAWWDRLVKSHFNKHGQDADFDFVGCFEAFHAFNEDLKHMNVIFPEHVTFDSTVSEDFQILLSRISTLVLNAPNTADQLIHLEGIPLGEELTVGAKQVYQEMFLPSQDPIQQNFMLLGQHWKKHTRVDDIRTAIHEVNKMAFSAEIKSKIMQLLTRAWIDENAPLDRTSLIEFLASIESQLQLIKEPGADQQRSDFLLAFAKNTKLGDMKRVALLMQQATDMTPPQLNVLNQCLVDHGFDFAERILLNLKKDNSSSELHSLEYKTALLQFINVVANSASKITELDINLDQLQLLLTATRALDGGDNQAFEAWLVQLQKYPAILEVLSQVNLARSKSLPTVTDLFSCTAYLAEKIEQAKQAGKTFPTETILVELGKRFAGDTVYGEADISNVSRFVVEGFQDTINKFAFLFKDYDMNPPDSHYDAYLKTHYSLKEGEKDFYRMDADNNKKYAVTLFYTLSKIPDILSGLKKTLNTSIAKLIRELGGLVTELEKDEPDFDVIIGHLGQITAIAENDLFEKELLLGYKGKQILPIVLTGEPLKVNGVKQKLSVPLLGDITDKLKKATYDSLCAELSNMNRPGIDGTLILDWLKQFCDSRSVLFFFKEMLVDRKVKPGILRLVERLDLPSESVCMSFKRNIERLIDSLDVQPEGMHKSDAELLQIYEQNISAISAYLESLKQLKSNNSVDKDQFISIFSKLESIKQLDYAQRAQLLQIVLLRPAVDACAYLDMIKTCFDTATSDFGQEPINRALNGIRPLMEGATSYDDSFCTGFLKTNFEHFLTSDQPFFLETLKQIDQLNLPPKEAESLRVNLVRLIQDYPELKAGVVNLLTFLSETRSKRQVGPDYTAFFVHMISKVKSKEDLEKVLAIKDKLLSGNQMSGVFESVAAIVMNLQKASTDESEDDKNEVTYIEKIFFSLLGKFSTESSSEHQYLLNLFRVYPQPKVKQFFDALKDTKCDLKKWCENFGKNPYGRDYAESLFKPEDLKRTISQLKNMMVENVSIPQKIQTHLVIQMNYIGSMEEELAQLPRETLQENASRLLREIRSVHETASNLVNDHDDPLLIQKDYEHKTLQLIAHMREAYKRSVGYLPHSTQILTLLLAMTSKDADQATSNLLMQIKTGEGKSLITPLLALCQWAKGGSVDICTANRTLAEEGFRKYGKPFFDFFVDEQHQPMIHTQWLENEKEKLPKDDDGRSIRFAAMEDLALIRLDTPPAPKTHLIYDEVDTVLDKPVLYNLAYQEADEKANLFTEFLCEQVDNFVEKNEFKDVDSPQAWSEDEDVFQFKLYLQQSTTYHDNADCQKRVERLTDFEAREWIDAMLTAKKLKQDTDFVIVKGTCLPLQNGVPQTGAYGNNVQQCLHFLNSIKKGSDAGCKVSAPTKIIKSHSATQMIKNYSGRLIGISGTLGERDELNAAHHLFGTQAVEVPPHRENKRLRRKPMFTKSAEASIQKVRAVINDKFKLDAQKDEPVPKVRLPEYNKGISEEEKQKLHEQAEREIDQASTQPILIIVDDYKKAKVMEKQLADYKAKGFTINCVTGDETLEELQSKIIAPAGNTRHITIATPHMGRGIDFSSVFNKGICLISLSTHPRTYRLEAQIEGRTARNGKAGEYVPIYQITPPKSPWAKFCFYLNWFISFYKGDAWQTGQWNAMVQEINEHYHEDRIYVNAIDNIQTCALNHIGEWEKLLREVNLDLNDAEKAALEDTFKAWRGEFFIKLGSFEEPGIPIGTAKQAAERFEIQIEEYFKNFRQRYIDKVGGISEHSKSWIDCEYLRHLELKDLLQEVHPMKMPNLTLGLEEIKLPNEGIIDFDLSINDKGYARWYYADDSAGFAEHEQCVLKHIHDELDKLNIAKPKPSAEKTIEGTIERLNRLGVNIDAAPAKDKLMVRPILWEFQHLCEIGKQHNLDSNKYAIYHDELPLRKEIMTKKFALDECLYRLANELMQASKWSVDNRVPGTKLVQWMSRPKMLKASKDIHAAADEVCLNNTPENRKALYRVLWALENELRDEVSLLVPVKEAVSPVDLVKNTLATLKSMIDLPGEQDKENFYQAKQEVELGVGWTDVVRSRRMEHMPDGQIKVQVKAEEAAKIQAEPDRKALFLGYNSSDKVRSFLAHEKQHLEQKLELVNTIADLTDIQKAVSDNQMTRALDKLQGYQEVIKKKQMSCVSAEAKDQNDRFLTVLNKVIENYEKLSTPAEKAIIEQETLLQACEKKQVEHNEEMQRISHKNRFLPNFLSEDYKAAERALKVEENLGATLRAEIDTMKNTFLKQRVALLSACGNDLAVIVTEWNSQHPNMAQEKETLEKALAELTHCEDKEKERSQFVTLTFKNEKLMSTFFASRRGDAVNGSPTPASPTSPPRSTTSHKKTSVVEQPLSRTKLSNNSLSYEHRITNKKAIFKKAFPTAEIGKGQAWGVNNCLIDSLLQLVGFKGTEDARKQECADIRQELIRVTAKTSKPIREAAYLPLESAPRILEIYFQRHKDKTVKAKDFQVIGHATQGENLSLYETSGNENAGTKFQLHVWNTGNHFEPIQGMPEDWKDQRDYKAMSELVNNRPSI